MAKIGCFYRDYNDSGGMPLEIKCLMKEVLNLGHKVTIYCYGNSKKSHIESNNYKVKQYKKPPLFLFLPQELKKDIISEGFDLMIIVSAHIRENYPISRFFSKNKIKYLYSPGAAYTSYLLNKNWVLKKIWRFFFELKILNNAEVIRTYSKTNEDYIIKYGGIKPTVEILEGIYEEDLSVTVENFNFHNNKLNIVYLGRIDYFGKGIDQLLIGFKEVVKSNFNVKLNIFGTFASNKDEIKFNSLLNQFSKEEVEYHGAIYGVKKHAMLKAADVFIYPSRHEGIPRSLREALFYNTPIIVTKETNFAEYVEKYQAGFSCDCTAQSISHAIEKYIQLQDKKSLSLNAKKLINDLYNWESVGLQFKKMLDNYSLLSKE